MTQREKLIELLKKFTTEECKITHECGYCDYGDLVVCASAVADHLLANGVVVPPVRVGDTVWFIRNEKIIETRVSKIALKRGGVYILLSCNSMYETSCRSIGKTVFLSRDDAEKSLKAWEETEKALAERSKT